ncbi:hypothetical protein F5X68DRAFT_235179 [Plectosphaerella plurivora]|uniref:Uncharacterized protein n=1 Tax=Plectosphaerella plurivora TaxID=936078 RepID=A0A9P9A7P5_9PEZI|nr:hypothetical protein F5X68DRAFT_235179 [Plectosphaerella plurivora]
MTCKDTTASYVCNDGPTHLTVACSALADFLDFILGNCCDCSRDSGPHYAISGQLFSPGGTFNVITGYGNCNHPVDMRPDSYNPPGPNGDCLINRYRGCTAACDFNFNFNTTAA